MTSLIRLFLTKITNLSQRHEHLCLTNFQVGIECCVRNTKKAINDNSFYLFYPSVQKRRGFTIQPLCTIMHKNMVD